MTEKGFNCISISNKLSYFHDSLIKYKQIPNNPPVNVLMREKQAAVPIRDVIPTVYHCFTEPTPITHRQTPPSRPVYRSVQPLPQSTLNRPGDRSVEFSARECREHCRWQPNDGVASVLYIELEFP